MIKIERKVNKWVVAHFLHVATFNFFLIGIFLLRSAGYFHPYFVISVNFIVLASLVMAVFLFRIGSRELFGFALGSFLFAGFLKIIKVDVWADRTSVYVFQASFMGFVMLIWESLISSKSQK